MNAKYYHILTLKQYKLHVLFFNTLNSSRSTTNIHWPMLLYCSCLFIFVIVCGFSLVEENLYRFLIISYVLPLEIQLSRGESWDPMNQFNPTTLLWDQIQNLDFQHHMSPPLLLVFSELKWKVIAGFVDIGGIIDHHCFNFLFMIGLLNKW
jgi:hypothetical protein